MTTPESIDDGVLALSPPRVLLVTQPVVGAHVGLSLASSDLIPDGEGATVEVDPPLSGTVDPGDVIWLWLLGETAFLDSKIITDVNAKTILRIPKGRLHPDRLNELFYTITRNSSNIGKSEPNLTLLYNKIRPGLKDRFPEIDGHSELALLLPDAIKHGVGPDFVSARVCVSYPYCRAYDTITLKCNGEIMTYKVGADEAPQPPNPGSADPITVCFTVTRAYLDSAVRPDGKLDFSCTCTDQLGNTPDTDAVWSATQRVDEDLAGTRLPAPILLERMGDYPGDDPSRIERDKLDGGPLFVIVATTDNRFLPGDIIEATYTAKVPGQPEDLVVLVNGVVETDPFGQKKPCILQVPNDKVIAESAVTVVYTLKRGDTVIASSATAKAQVIAERTITLNPPVPAANPVDPLAHSQGVEVEVAFAGSLPKDQALLVAVNALPGSLPFSMLPLDPDHRAVFTLDAAFLGLWHGKQPQLRWDLIRNGEVIAQSSALVLTVNRIAHEDPRLTRPVIVGQTGRILDVTQLLPTDKLSIAQWLLQTQYIPVWLRFDGILANGQSDFRIIWSGQIHRFEPSDLVISLTAALVNWLKSLKDDSEVTITFAVNFDKVVDGVAAVRFPVRTYTVQAVPALSAPTLVPPATIPIDPLDHAQGVKVRVDFAAAQPGDKAQLKLVNPLPGSPEFLELSLDQKFAIFTLDVVFLGLWHGKAPQLRWDLIRGGEVIAESLALVVTVLPISNGDERLLTPKILQAANDGDGPELDVSNLTAGAMVRCLVWPLIAFGQPVWLHLRGKNASGGEHNITLLRHPNNAVHYAWLNAGYYNTSVLYSYLKDLGNGSVLEVWFTAALDKGTDESKAVRFKIRTYTVKALPAFELDQTEMVLDGFNISIFGSGLNWPLTGKDPAGTAATRVPTLGTAPYTYWSSHPNIASVDSNGRVRSEGNGQATIYVSDQHQTKSYAVRTSNVTTYLYNPTPMTQASFRQWVNNVGGQVLTEYASENIYFQIMRAKYRPPNSPIITYRFTDYIGWPDRPPYNYIGLLTGYASPPEPQIFFFTAQIPMNDTPGGGGICFRK